MRCYGLRKKAAAGRLFHYDFEAQRWYPWFDETSVTSTYSEALTTKDNEGGEIYELELRILPKE